MSSFRVVLHQSLGRAVCIRLGPSGTCGKIMFRRNHSSLRQTCFQLCSSCSDLNKLGQRQHLSPDSFCVKFYGGPSSELWLCCVQVDGGTVEPVERCSEETTPLLRQTCFQPSSFCSDLNKHWPKTVFVLSFRVVFHECFCPAVCHRLGYTTVEPVLRPP